MTVSSTVGTALTITQVCLAAYQGIGLRSTQQGTADVHWTNDFAFAKTQLEFVLADLANHGEFPRGITFETIDVASSDVTAETYKYSLDTTDMDVVGDAAWIPSSESDTDRADGETVIKQVSQADWHQLSSHGATGRPTMFYVHRVNDTLQAWLWPIPDGAGAFRLRVHRKLSDCQDGSATIDLEEHWMDYVLVALQHKISRAKSLPLQLQQSLYQESLAKLGYAKGKAQSRAVHRPYLDHPSAWSR